MDHPLIWIGVRENFSDSS